MQKVTKDTTLAEVLELPKAEGILAEYKVPCLTCPMAKIEMQTLKVGEICERYGIDADKLLKDLNKSSS